MTILVKTFTLLVLLTGSVMAKELPSWGMTETQYKMPNFASKMKKIGDQAVNNDWLLKITAPKDWRNKIRAALSNQGAQNVQINFKDSLYKSIAITATQGMALKSTTTDNKQPGVVKKQVVIEKPEMDTEIEAPEFDNDFNTKDILADMGEIELTLPSNGKPNGKPTQTKKASIEKDESEKKLPNSSSEPVVNSPSNEENTDVKELKENLRIRYARGKAVDKSISYANITDEDDLYVADHVVLVKRYVNRGVAIYYWMKEAYDPDQHILVEKGSGKYVKSDNRSAQNNKLQNTSAVSEQEATKTSNKIFDFVAVTDNQSDQDSLRQRYIRNKAVNSTIKASQLKSDDVLYVSNQTVLVERPLGNSRHAYFWLKGDTDTQQSIEPKGPQQFVIQ